MGFRGGGPPGMQQGPPPAIPPGQGIPPPPRGFPQGYQGTAHLPPSSAYGGPQGSSHMAMGPQGSYMPPQGPGPRGGGMSNMGGPPPSGTYQGLVRSYSVPEGYGYVDYNGQYILFYGADATFQPQIGAACTFTYGIDPSGCPRAYQVSPAGSGYGVPQQQEMLGCVRNIDASGLGWLSSEDLGGDGQGYFRITRELPPGLCPGRLVSFTVVTPASGGYSAEVLPIKVIDPGQGGGPPPQPQPQRGPPARSGWGQPAAAQPGPVPTAGQSPMQSSTADSSYSSHTHAHTPTAPCGCGYGGWSPTYSYSDAFPGGGKPLIQPPQPGQRPWELDVVVFHASCMDGLCAAYTIWAAAGRQTQERLQMIPAAAKIGTSMSEFQAETGENTFRGKRVALVDLSLPLKELQELQSECESLVVIDHHKSHEKDLTALAEITPGAVRFDLTRSAAVLTLEFVNSCIADALAGGQNPVLQNELFYSPAPINVQALLQGQAPAPSRLMQLVQEVDLGRFGVEYPEARRFAIGLEAMQFHSSDLQLKLQLPRVNAPQHGIKNSLRQLRRMFQQGDSIVEQILALGTEGEAGLEIVVAQWQATRSVRRFLDGPAGEVVSVVELPPVDHSDPIYRGVPLRFARSELGHRLAREDGITCGVVVAGNSVQLRCEPGQADVSQIAQRYGGGGHQTAAAFQLQPDQKVDTILAVLSGD